VINSDEGRREVLRATVTLGGGRAGAGWTLHPRAAGGPTIISYDHNGGRQFGACITIGPRLDPSVGVNGYLRVPGSPFTSDRDF